MPVVEVSLGRLAGIAGCRDARQVADMLPYLGLDIESRSADRIRIEYSPNRPDYSTEYGLALGLEGLLGTAGGAYVPDIPEDPRYEVYVDRAVQKIRPSLACMVARGGTMTDSLITQLVSMQEDLHLGIGRRRRKASIGMHDLDSVSFPLKYTVAGRRRSFVPLHSDKESAISGILADTAVGREYGRILPKSGAVPIIEDSEKRIISFPPIINSAMTEMTQSTRNILVEITGIQDGDVVDMLSVVAATLCRAGFRSSLVRVRGARIPRPRLDGRKMTLDASLANRTLGISLSPRQVAAALKRSRIGASVRAGKIECVVPRYRFDIFGPMDLVEEVALGYGIESLEPVLPPAAETGRALESGELLSRIDSVMTGLGYTEVLNSCLTDPGTLYEMMKKSDSDALRVLESKSREHTALRDSLLPGLCRTLSQNIHEQYPQRLYETGVVFERGKGISEIQRLGCVTAHTGAGFTDAKSVLETVMQDIIGSKYETRAAQVPGMQPGRSAEITIGDTRAGTIGELSADLIARLKMRVPVAAFELEILNI